MVQISCMTYNSYHWSSQHVYRCPDITKQNNEKIHNDISEVSKGDCIIMGGILTRGILNGIHYKAQG